MRNWILALAAGAALAGAARAEEGDRPLRLIGQAPSAQAPIPKAFVIEAVLEDTGEDLRADVEGWFAGLPPDDGLAGEIEGSCVEERCALTVDLPEGGELVLSGDLAGKSPTGVRIAAKDYDEKTVGQVQASLRPFGGDVPGLGKLAADSAVTADGLADLLVWGGRDLGFSNLDDRPISDRERDALLEWQAEKQRPATGLLTEADLAQLRSEAEAARKAAGWTELTGTGWKLGYPAALLPRASGGGRERRFSSADGKASLLVAFDPPMSDEAWDAFIDRETEDREEIENRNYTRVNDDFELRYTAKGVVTAAAYHRREGGVVKAVLTYPEGAEALAPFETIVPRTFRVGDEVKAP